MFIVTMIFLTGLIFAVQQLLLQYSALDLSEPLQRSDIYIYRDVQDMVGSVMPQEDCRQAMSDLQEIDSFIKSLGEKGYILELTYNGQPDPVLDCQFWNTSDPVLILNIMVTGPGTETTGTVTYFSGDYAGQRRGSEPPQETIPPNIEDASIDPTSGPTGTEFNITATISDQSGVDADSVGAEIINASDDSIINNIPLELISGDANSGVYEGIWMSTEEGSYYSNITACDVYANCAEVKVQ